VEDFVPVRKSRHADVKKSFPRGPYLSWSEDPTTTITISYASNKTEPDSIYYGCGSEPVSMVNTGPGTEKVITLRGLNPSTSYYYKIGSEGRIHSFKTAPDVSQPFKFVVYGDYAQLGNKQIKQQLYSAIMAEKPDFILFPGDLVANGNLPRAWKRDFFDYIKDFWASLPLMAVPGNHDGTGALFKYYLHYPQNRTWYRFNYSNALFLAVNTQAKFTAGSPQHKFITETLRSDKSDWKFVYLHKPPYSTNACHHSNLKVRSLLCPIFEKYEIDVVFCGHNHAYERTLPIRKNRVDLENGITYITSGGGGAILKPFIPYRKLTRWEKQWSKVRIKDYHYLRVMVAGNTLVIEAKNLANDVIDRYEKVKG